ncbi:Rz1-like lysis system protein LysC [Klebsiella oxytoca]|uniref:Rz1-like lysis system protein LysC n=2 Tax=Klebsiella TaxID=570 RepID=UPI003AB942ED
MKNPRRPFVRLSKRTLPVVLVAGLMLTSCRNSPEPGREQQQPLPRVLPARMTVPCPRPVFPASSSMDDLAVAQKQLYDQYGLCAGQLVEVIKCAQEGNCGNK